MKDKYVRIKLYGLCNGFFGRDSYEDKTVIASGDDWLVAKDDSGETRFAHFFDNWKDKMGELISEWSSDKAKEEWSDQSFDM